MTGFPFYIFKLFQKYEIYYYITKIIIWQGAFGAKSPFRHRMQKMFTFSKAPLGNHKQSQDFFRFFHSVFP